MYKISHEKDDEGDGCPDESYGATGTYVLVIDIVDDIEDAKYAGQENNGKAEDEHPGIKQGVESVGGVGPSGDDRGDGIRINQIVFLDDEVRPFEEGGYGSAKEQRTNDAIEGEEELEGPWPQNVAYLVLKLITDGL